jgi:predicted ATPase
MHEDPNRIREQFAAGLWPKFLEAIALDGIRGWTGQAINFRFPIVAIVGENGTGKSTVLKAAACGYENERESNRGHDQTFFPSDFFLSTHWDRVENVTFTYSIRQGSMPSTHKIRKLTRRWRLGNRPRRNVFYFDISRTLPLDASVGYARIARIAASEVSSNAIETNFLERLAYILGRNYTQARFVTSDADKKREVGLLTREFGEMSQYHQGAGEDSTLDLFRSLQNLPDTSLLIIDEVEASLHPRAQRRLVQFLLWLSRTKRVQTIISTHSPYVLEELPTEARILLLRDSTGVSCIYGASPEFALSKLDEMLHPELSLFVEDRESVILLRELIGSETDGHEMISRLSIIPVGASNAVAMLGQLGGDNRLPFRSLAIVDGDTEAPVHCFTVPGRAAPERVVFEGLKAKQWQHLPERFGIGAGDLIGYLEDAMLDPDHHQWPKRVGDRLLRSKASVWETLCIEWVKSCATPSEKEQLINGIRNALPQ